MTHLLSIILLLLKIRTTKSCAGTYNHIFHLFIDYDLFLQESKWVSLYFCWDHRNVDEFGNFFSRVNLICHLSVPGISLKTQELYVLVFISRYIDLFIKYYSLYNSVMKVVFLGTSFAIVWYMRFHKVVKQTYSKDEDTFKHYFLILASFLLALVIPRAFNTVEVWCFLSYIVISVCMVHVQMRMRTNLFIGDARRIA